MRLKSFISGYIVGLVVCMAPMALAADLPEPASKTIDFAHDIHPILAQHCFECHGGDKRKGDFQLDSHGRLLHGVDGSPAVLEGNSAESLLIEVVATADTDFRMPPKGGGLTDDEVALLRAWIDQGISWNLTEMQSSGYKMPLGLQVPELKGSEANVIDRYLAPYLKENDVALADAVSDARYLRRVSLDITGLLPGPEALQEFVARTDTNKRAALVTGLLADDQAYAEHWMSFWNDLLRNDFEGTGYIDGGRKQITRWLYDALYNNMPYDQFVEELIAPKPASEGFIKGIVWRGDNAVVVQPPMQAARGVSMIFLGLNLKCASCHDSFTDHWTMEETYGLANCFSDDPIEMRRCEVATGKQAGHRFLWPELGDIDSSLSKRKKMQRVAELVTTPKNGPFARTIVNRVWARFMGRGLVEPVDAIELEPWSPALLDALAQDFVNHGYDLRHLMKTIVTSQAYQLPAVAREENDTEAYVFKGPELRRLTAEQFYDGLSTLSGLWQANPKFLLPQESTPEEEERQRKLAQAAAGGKSEQVRAKDNTVTARRKPVRAWRIPADAFTRAMGRTNREQFTTFREQDFTTLQSLEMTNGAVLNAFIDLCAEAVLVDGRGNNPGQLVEDVYLQALQRGPEKREVKLALELLGDDPERAQVADLLWAVVMLPEFQIIY